MSFLKGVVFTRSWGQQEESRTAGGFEDSGGEEDSGTSWGQCEESRTAGVIKKGSIHYLLKKVVLHLRIVSMFTILKLSSLLAQGTSKWRRGHGGSGGQREENELGAGGAGVRQGWGWPEDGVKRLTKVVVLCFYSLKSSWTYVMSSYWALFLLLLFVYISLTIIVSCQCNEWRPSCRVKKKMLMKRTDGLAARYAGVVV